MKIRVTTHSYALQKLGIIPNLGVKGYGSRTTISRPTTPAKTLLLLKMRVETLILTLGLVTVGALGTDEHHEERGHLLRGILGDKLIAGANKLFGKAGILECNGIQSVRTGSFLHQIFGDRPTLGNAMCGPTCGGHCVPFNSFADAPTSISYAFGCKCPAQRCSPGPIPDPLDNPSYKVACTPDQSCTCAGMGYGTYSGHLCNWVNINTQQKVTFAQMSTNQGRQPIQLHPAILP
ncbi:hypothetical protein Fcan01_24750, partial [Folsomia candida]